MKRVAAGDAVPLGMAGGAGYPGERPLTTADVRKRFKTLTEVNRQLRRAHVKDHPFLRSRRSPGFAQRVSSAWRGRALLSWGGRARQRIQFPKPTTSAFDVHLMEEAVWNGGDQALVAREHVRPIARVLVGGHDDAAPPVLRRHQPEGAQQPVEANHPIGDLDALLKHQLRPARAVGGSAGSTLSTASSNLSMAVG